MIAKTTALTFLSRRCQCNTADEYGDDETSAPRLQTAELEFFRVTNDLCGHFLFHPGCGELSPWRK